MNRQNHRWDLWSLAEKLDFRMDFDRAVQKRLKRNGGATTVSLDGPGPVFFSSDEEVVRQLLPLPFHQDSDDNPEPSDSAAQEYQRFRHCFENYKKAVIDPDHQQAFFNLAKKMICQNFNHLDSGKLDNECLQRFADQLVSETILGSVFRKISTPMFRKTRSYHETLGKGFLIHSVFKNPLFAKSLTQIEDIGLLTSGPKSLSHLWMFSGDETQSSQSLSYLLKDLALGSGDPIWWQFNTGELNLNARMMTEAILHTIPAILEHLSQDHSIQERLYSEIMSCESIDHYDSLVSLPFLDAVCKEGLRLHPVFPVTLVSVTRSMRLGGKLLMPGTVAGIANRILHRDSLQWYLPERFIPERFIGRKTPSVHYLPFGVLPDHSPGSGIIFSTMKLILVFILSRFRVSRSEMNHSLISLIPDFLRPNKGSSKLFLEERSPGRMTMETIRPEFYQMPGSHLLSS